MPSLQLTPRVFFVETLANERPKAMAWVVDQRNNPNISGLVKFYQPSNGGILTEAEFFGLPEGRPGLNSGFFAMHIHEAENCSQVMSPNGTSMIPPINTPIMPRTGNSPSAEQGARVPSNSMMPNLGNPMMTDPIPNPMMGHFNPGGMSHPYHVGDLPPLLANQGYAWTAFFDRRFTLEEIMGKTVVIHSHHDDFNSPSTEPAGKPIACGEIRRTY